METVKSFFSYFFKTPGVEFSYYIPISILCGLLIIGSIVFSFIYKKKKKTDFAFKRLFKNISKRMVIVAILFIVLMLIRYQNIAYLSVRFWMYLVGAIFIYFIYNFLKKYLKDYPRERENTTSHIITHSTKKENKYLPNK